MKKLLKRFSLYAVGATFGLGVLFMPDIALAQVGGTNDALKNFSEIAATIVHLISAAAMLMMQFFPPLWGSELITGGQVTEMLRPMWIYVRNLCNIAFVGMLLFLALSNMLTSGKGVQEWNIKSKLGPIILGLVAINFSMLAVRVLVDVVHVGTVALLSIADPVIDARGIDNVADYYSRKIDTETFEPCDSGANCKTVRELVNGTFCASDESCLFKIREISDIQRKAAAMNNPERKNIMLGFGTFFMKLESLPLLSADTRGILDVLDSTLFSLVFGVAYLLALLAIMVVLLMRVVMMWLFTIFSPLLVMSWVMGFKLPLIGDQFWTYLLVPLKAAGALAFGFVMISQLELMTIPAEFFVSVIEPGPSLQALWGPDEFGGWRMLWKILTVVLFWKVVFDFALKDIEGMDKIVGGIKGFGEGLGNTALSAVGEIPLPGLSTEANPVGLNNILRNFSPSRLNQFANSMRTNPQAGLGGVTSAWQRSGAGQVAQAQLRGQGNQSLSAVQGILRDGQQTQASLLANSEMQTRLFNSLNANARNTLGGVSSAEQFQEMYRNNTNGFRQRLFGSAGSTDTPPAGTDPNPPNPPTSPAVTLTREGDTNNFSLRLDESSAPINVEGAEAGDRQTVLATELAGVNHMTVERVREIAQTIASHDPDYLGNASTAEAALVTAFEEARASSS